MIGVLVVSVGFYAIDFFVDFAFMDAYVTAFTIAKELSIVKDYSEVATGKEVADNYEKGEEVFDKFIKNTVG